MSIENKRMQQRYGTYEQFQNDRTNLLPNEFASVISGDENTASGRGLYFNFGTNTANRILTDEDKQELETNQMLVDTDTTTVEFNTNNPKIIYVNALVDNVKGFVVTVADNSVQFFIGSNGIIKYRSQNGVDTYGSWQPFGKSAITNANKDRADYIPSIKAVVDYIANIVATLETALGRKESTFNKVSSMPESPTTAQYLSAMAVKLYVESKGYLTSTDIEDKEDTSNKVTSISKNSTDTQYASAKCVYDNTVNKIEFINVTDYISIANMSNFTDQTKLYHFFCDDVSIHEECTLQFIWSGEIATGQGGVDVYPNSTQIIITGTGRVLKRTSDDEGIWGNLIEMERTSNKVAVINPNTATNDQYPSTLAVVNYVNSVLNN